MPFSDRVVEAAWERAEGRCECKRVRCGHETRCNRRLSWNSRGIDDDLRGWEAHHITAASKGRTDSLSNCEILCIACHKNTQSYGHH